MRLARIVRALDAGGQVSRAPDGDPEIAAVTDDSRHVRAGALFCAVEGTVQDGHTFLDEAIRRGAVAALVTRPRAELAVPQVVVRHGRRAAALAAAELHGRPADRLALIGVTGTNGKSTTVALIRHLLNADASVGSLGTLGAWDGAGEPVSGGGELTTPGPTDLHGALAALVDRGCRTVVMEASSHALEQDRLYGLTYRMAVYTNLTHDHLDYHPDVDAYRRAKMRLSGLLAADGVEVVNLDDPAWTALPARPGGTRVTYGLDPAAAVRADAPVFAAEGTAFTLYVQGRGRAATCPLPGAFNVSNALGAVAAGHALGTDVETLAARLATAPQVPGRMERLAAGDEWVVLRDYAHTPDALRRAIDALRPLVTGRLIVLFGCGGDRDRGKRPRMGRIVADGADVAIVTSDNPRTEDPERILDDIEAGMGSTARVRIADRREAIARGLELLRPGDCLLLAGKGHETCQIVGTERRPFDERIVVRELLGVGTS